MKTNVVMTRKMGEFDIHQRTSDGYFDANVLLSEWNKSDLKKSISKRQMSDFIDSSKTKEFIDAILREESQGGKNLIAVIQTIKGRATKFGRTSDQVWMHPLLFIDFAMWINPSFKVKVLKFVYDELIKYRHNAGDMYVGLSKSISKFRDVDYSLVGKALNYIVFGKHEAGIRNIASEIQLKELEDLQKNLSFSIDTGLINSFESLVDQMRVLYNKKWNPIKSIVWTQRPIMY